MSIELIKVLLLVAQLMESQSIMNIELAEKMKLYIEFRRKRNSCIIRQQFYLF